MEWGNGDVEEKIRVAKHTHVYGIKTMMDKKKMPIKNIYLFFVKKKMLEHN